MCTILLAWRCVDGADFVLAANRDELLDRPAVPPHLLSTDPPVAGGQDLLAGGTWLAVDAHGRVAAVTNRRLPGATEVVRDPDRRSRGEIPLRLLADLDEHGVRDLLRALGPGRYNPVNVLYVSSTAALVAAVDDTGPPRVTALRPGLHVLTVGDVDDPGRPKDAALTVMLREALDATRDAAELEVRLRGVLGRHESPTSDPLDAPCIHGDVYGTVSSSTVISGDAGPVYRHAAGCPGVTPFELVTVLPRPG